MTKKEKNKVNRKEIQCLKCKVKFDSWLSGTEFTSDVEGEIKENFHLHCPSCRTLEQNN
ncbi:MAG: hypothetical protein KJI70_01395 [Patescibacteria group bacterium]|nr:hypothetical protein [Patescibacteria group bacterium]